MEASAVHNCFFHQLNLAVTIVSDIGGIQTASVRRR